MSTSTSEFLYKYRKFDINSLRILTCKELYFAKPESLNDPWDCQVPVLTLLDQVIASEAVGESKYVLSKLRDMKVKNRLTGDDEIMHLTFEDFPRKAGVLSLSRNPTDALLWSHYANGHRGFSIGFDESYFDQLLTDWQQHDLLGVSDVKYVDALLCPLRDLWLQKAKEIEAIRNASAKNKETEIFKFRESYVRDLFATILTTKSKDWVYECEYRAVKAQHGNIAFPPLALREIVFGMKSSEADQKMVRALLNGQEWEHVHFRRTVCTAGSFSLKLANC